MNGRLYDPFVGRFLSLDNYVQNPSNSQNYNRYSYCLNNPLKYNDPSGDLFGEWQWIIGGVKGLFNGHGFFSSANQQFRNYWDINFGLFQGSSSQIFSRFTKEAPQTFLGFHLGHVVNTIGADVNVEYFHGATLVNRNSNSDVFTGFTLGSYIMGKNLQTSINSNSSGKERARFYAFAHEYGHYLQSYKNGPTYLFKYALPNLMDVTFRGDKAHDNYWGEKDANSRAFEFFTKTDIQSQTNFNESEFINGIKQSSGIIRGIHPLGVIRNSNWLDYSTFLLPPSLRWMVPTIVSYYE